MTGVATRSETTARILEQIARADEPAVRQQLGDELVVRNMAVADQVAAGFRHRGVAEEDLRQVAYLALVKAVRRYDESAAGADFLSYAVPTIKGELRQHLRDHGWVIRPTRRVQELRRALLGARHDVEVRLGRPAQPSELAAHLGECETEVREALASRGCFQPSSLDAPPDGHEASSLADSIRYDERGWEGVEARVVLKHAGRELSQRERHILYLRFFEGRSQQEIADDLGVTQMQVSRLLRQICERMRDRVGDPHDAAGQRGVGVRQRMACS
jgi:RNA polymerase sigma-B factor